MLTKSLNISYNINSNMNEIKAKNLFLCLLIFDIIGLITLNYLLLQKIINIYTEQQLGLFVLIVIVWLFITYKTLLLYLKYKR